MKHIITTSIAALAISSAAYADGPGPVGTYDPPVVAPPTSNASPFTGGYAGVMFSKHESELRRSEEYTPSNEIPVTEVCPYTSGHSGGLKCKEFPTRLVATEFPSVPKCGRDYSKTCIIRDNGDGTTYMFIKGGTGSGYEYETGETTIEYGETVLRSITESFMTEEVGVFAGYRVDLGVIAGFEVSSDALMSTAELSVGYDIGNVLGYAFAGVAQFDGDEGSVYGIGAEYLIDADWTVGLKGTAGDFGDVTTETVALRVGYNF